jgi:predicted ATP-binding protein involved in virulence
MKIKRIKINDFRGFREFVVGIPTDSNVIAFIGKNGAGKSAILDSVSLLLSILVKNIRSKTNGLPSQFLNKDDINSHAERYQIQIDFCCTNNHYSSNPYTISLTESLNDKRIIDGTYNDFVDTTRSLLNIPILIHYQINRNVVEKTKKTNSPPKYTRGYDDAPQFSTYENAFSGNINSFNDFVKWFREEEDLENQIQRDHRNFEHRNDRLEVVRNAINKFLNKFDESARFSDLRIERERTSSKSIRLGQESIVSSLVIDKDGQKFKFSQLSSGETTILSLVVDIARRLTIANPDIYDKLSGEGIVLIDEIDLHLHPQWQRKFLPALVHTFPNLQFIVTTHSPQVLSHIARDSVFLLEDNKISERDIYTEGRDSNSILQDAFHVPIVEEEYEREINEIYYLIDEHNLEKAQMKLEKLKEKRGEDDREVLRMESFINMDRVL